MHPRELYSYLSDEGLAEALYTTPTKYPALMGEVYKRFSEYIKKGKQEIEYDVDKRDDGTYLVTGTDGTELIIVPPKELSELSTYKNRIRWIEMHPSHDHDSGDGKHWITAWVSEGEPGNLKGPSGMYTAISGSFLECLDKYLAGDIVRID